MPAINFDGACYELELVKAQDVKSIQRACNVDQQFQKFATRINKVCCGTASCSDVPMDKDLFIDLEDFAKAFRKEVPPGVRINVKNLFGTAMQIDRHGKSRFEMLCARIPLCSVHNGLQADQDDTQLYPVKIKATQGHSKISWKMLVDFLQLQLRSCVRHLSFLKDKPPPLWTRSQVLRTIEHNGATGRAPPKVDCFQVKPRWMA